MECSRYIHLNPNRSRLTRPAERYRWSSYRDYVGGPSLCDWVETSRMLGHFAGDRLRYRRYVEAGKGERPVSPFERAMADLVLGGEDLTRRVRKMVARRRDREQPSLGELERSGRLGPEEVEAGLARVFGDVSKRSWGQLLVARNGGFDSGTLRP